MAPGQPTACLPLDARLVMAALTGMSAPGDT